MATRQMTASETIVLSDAAHRNLSARTARETFTLVDSSAVGCARVCAETIALTDIGDRRLEVFRIGVEEIRPIDTAKIPGGTSGYEYDVAPFDRKVVCQRLTRKLWVESLNVGP